MDIYTKIFLVNSVSLLSFMVLMKVLDSSLPITDNINLMSFLGAWIVASIIITPVYLIYLIVTWPK